MILAGVADEAAVAVEWEIPGITYEKERDLARDGRIQREPEFPRFSWHGNNIPDSKEFWCSQISGTWFLFSPCQGTRILFQIEKSALLRRICGSPDSVK